MEEKNKNKKKKIIRIVSLLGLFLFVLGVSYALFTVVLNGTKKNRITTGDLGLILTDTSGTEEKDLPEGMMGVNLEEVLPMTQEEGLQTEPYKFVVKNIGNIPVSYKLKLNDIEGVENTLKDEYIRYNLIEKDYLKEYREGAFPQGYYSTEKQFQYNEYMANKNPYFDASPKLSESSNRILEETTILPGESIEYNLNLWLDEKATIEQAANKTFEGKIEVDGTQAISYMTGKAGDNIDYTLYNDGTLVYNGTGAMSGLNYKEDDSYEITNNGGALLDIMYKHLENSGLDVKKVDDSNIDIYLGIIMFYLYFDVGNDFDTIYNNLSPNFETMFNTVPDKETLRKAIDTVPIITRIVLNEGITTTAAYTTLSNKGMVSLPTTLTTIEPGSFMANPFLNIPKSVTNINSNPNILCLAGIWTINIDNTKEFVEANFEYEKDRYSSWEDYQKCQLAAQNINYSK